MQVRLARVLKISVDSCLITLFAIVVLVTHSALCCHIKKRKVFEEIMRITVLCAESHTYSSIYTKMLATTLLYKGL